MLGIHELFQVIAATFNILSTIVYFGISISSFIGHFIVKYVLSVMTVMCSTAEIVFNVVRILYEDYCIFLLDVINKGAHLISILKYFVDSTIQEVCNICGNMKDFFLSTYAFAVHCKDSVCFILVKAVNFIACIPDILKHFVTLVGSGIWLALKLIPLGLVYFFSMCIFFVGRSIDELKSVVQSVVLGILHILNVIARYFSEIPFEAQAGFIFGIALMYVCIKYHSHIIQCSRYLQREIQFMLNFLWTSLESFLLRIFTSLVNDPPRPRNVEPTQEGTASIENENEGSTDQDDCCNASRSSSKKYLHDQENLLCVVCQDRDKCIIILPCRHLCLCVECSKIIRRQNGICPICREDVRRTMKVYV